MPTSVQTVQPLALSTNSREQGKDGLGDRPDLLADMVPEFLHDRVPGVHGIPAHDHEGDNRLAGGLVRSAHDGGLRHHGVADQGGFDFGGGEPVAGKVHHFIDATELHAHDEGGITVLFECFTKPQTGPEFRARLPGCRTRRLGSESKALAPTRMNNTKGVCCPV